MLAAACLLSACGGGSDEPSSTQESAAATSSAPPAAAMTLEELGVADWPAADPLEFAKAPKAPDWFDGGRFDDLVNVLKMWARASFLDESVREADDPRDELRSTLGFKYGSPIYNVMSDNPVPGMSAANVFAPGVEVLGPPVMTTAWKVEGITGGVRVHLQARGFYRVRGEDGAESVVGVIRTNSMAAPTEEWNGQPMAGYHWQVFGVDDCALATGDSLRPAKMDAKAKKDLQLLVDAGTSRTFAKTPLGKSETVDEKMVDRCQKDAA